MSEQNVREAEQAADEWIKDNPYRAAVRPAFISGYQAAQAALTSSPSEPLVDVEGARVLVDRIREGSSRECDSQDVRMDHEGPLPQEWVFDLTDRKAAALITARDAQVAARVREGLGEDDYLLTLSMDERHWLSELVESRRDELRRLLSGWLEHDDREAYEKESDIAERVNDECMCLVGKGVNARAALTATGGGE